MCFLFVFKSHKAIRYVLSAVYMSTCLHSPSNSALHLGSTRLPESEPAADHREEDLRVHREPGRLPPLRHDLRQLPEAARLLQH